MQDWLQRLHDSVPAQVLHWHEAARAWLASLPMSREAWMVVIAQAVLLLAALGLALRRRRPAAAGTVSPPPSAVRASASRGRAVGGLEPSSSVVGHMTAGLLTVVALVGGLGAWAATSQIAGAVIAQASVVVESNVKKVQHSTGGIVGEILVREGDRVAAGDLLMRLDETQLRANLQIIAKQLVEAVVRQTRLLAERDQDGVRKLQDTLAQRLSRERHAPPVDELEELVQSELQLFETRHRAREGQKAQLRERIAQLTEEISGIAAQRDAKSREIDLVRRELASIETLEAKQLVSINRITSLRREAARIDGERGQLQAAVAQARGRIAEIELQILQVDNDLRAEVSKELREMQGKEAELIERRIAAQDQLTRVDIRAPQAGTVHQLSVHTVGGVIGPAEQVMLIVPDGDRLVIEAKIAPQDIDQVRARQRAYVRFPAFNQRTTPEIGATVLRVSADLMKEPQTGFTYFTARLEPTTDDLARLGGQHLIPGMPAEVHIRTGARTALSYLVKPIEDQFARAFRER